MAHRLETTDAVRQRMAAQRRADTRLELELRRALFAEGYRYRVGYPVPGMPRRSIDICFTRLKVAVFVDGCFWHRCPVHSVAVKNNGEWWREKLEHNIVRDRETTVWLEQLGWTVIRVWEHESVRDARSRIVAALESRSEGMAKHSAAPAARQPGDIGGPSPE